MRINWFLVSIISFVFFIIILVVLALLPGKKTEDVPETTGPETVLTENIILDDEYYADENTYIFKPEKNENYKKANTSEHNYNMLMYCLEDYYDGMNGGFWEHAYSVTNPMFLEYKDLKSIDLFKDYAVKAGLDNTTALLLSAGEYSKDVFICDIRVVKRVDEENYSSVQRFKHFMGSAVYTEKVVIILTGKDGYLISPTDYIVSDKMDTVITDNSYIKVTAYKKHIKVSNTVYECSVENKTDKHINLQKHMGDDYYITNGDIELATGETADKVYISSANSYRDNIK
jgi:hypothetical protein